MQIIEIYSDIGASKRGAAQGVGLLDTLLKKSHQPLMANALKIFNDFADFAGESEADFEPCERAKAIDYAKNIEAIYGFFKDKLIPAMSSVMAERKRLVILSGDHSNALGSLQACKKAYPKESIGIIWVDAHSDLHTPYDSPSGNIHGMPLGGVLDVVTSGENTLTPTQKNQWKKLCSLAPQDNRIAPQNLVYAGVRSMEKSEREVIRKFQIPLYRVAEIRKDIAGVVDKIASCLQNVDRIYLSVDVDVLDGKIFTSTGVRENNGLYPVELDRFIGLLIERFAQKLIAIEFTEFNPALKDSHSQDNEVLTQIVSSAITKLELQR
ncbi:arginase [Helicobacter sp. 11S02596-1]|nr:arginase [Helicobacter sp. 11S02596-1]